MTALLPWFSDACCQKMPIKPDWNTISFAGIGVVRRLLSAVAVSVIGGYLLHDGRLSHEKLNGESAGETLYAQVPDHIDMSYQLESDI
jgi:hypothetical protein